MKKSVAILCLSILSIITLNAQNWLTDIDQAKDLAEAEEKPIILVFQGSDWCASCIKMDHEIWSTTEFIGYADEHYIMVKADFPQRKKNALDPELQSKNNQLAEQYNTNGFFPYVLKLDAEGNVLGSTSYKKVSPADFIKFLNNLNS